MAENTSKTPEDWDGEADDTPQDGTASPASGGAEKVAAVVAPPLLPAIDPVPILPSRMASVPPVPSPVNIPRPPAGEDEESNAEPEESGGPYKALADALLAPSAQNFTGALVLVKRANALPARNEAQAHAKRVLIRRANALLHAVQQCAPAPAIHADHIALQQQGHEGTVAAERFEYYARGSVIGREMLNIITELRKGAVTPEQHQAAVNERDTLRAANAQHRAEAEQSKKEIATAKGVIATLQAENERLKRNQKK